MKLALICLALLIALPASAQDAVAPAQIEAATKYSTKTSTLGQLLENPATKALFEKYFPEVAHHERISEGLDLTLPDVVQYLPDVVTPEKLAAMDAELKTVP